MRVIYCRPLNATKPRDAVCFVDVELNEHMRLNGLRLVRQPDGTHFIYAPQAGERRCATFSAPMAQRLTELAVEAYEARR